MRLGILGAIGMAFDGDMRHGLLEVVLGDAVFRRVGRGKLSEIAGRRADDANHVEHAAARPHRQTAVPRVFQFLDTHGERNISRAGGDGINGTAEGVRARGAVVFYLGHADIIESQRHA